jgi:hypothetical protein
VKLTIDIAGEDTQVEQIGTDSVSKLHIRMQVGSVKDATIKALAMHNTLIATHTRKYDERSFKSKVCTAIPTRRVVPVVIKQMESSTDFILPPYGQVATGKVGKINKVHPFLLCKHTSTITIIKVRHRREADALVNVSFQASIGAIASKHPFKTMFVIK